MILYVCETCATFSPVERRDEHQGHNVTALRGDDFEELARVAAKHIVLSRRIRTGIVPRILTGDLHEVGMLADWFSEEDAVYD